LLNDQGYLEIKKVYSATAVKPKAAIFFVCNHPCVNGANDLLTLKQSDLRARARELEIPTINYNASTNSSIRSAIWNSFTDLAIANVELLVDAGDTKKVYESIASYLPVFALFQSDRKSVDDDKEVVDPMKIAVQQALAELETEINDIKLRVQSKAEETANRTLEKLREMSPDLASILKPDFKSEPKFDSLFKLTLSSDDNIPINKRGSGVRRLILLNFFRAEAERRGRASNNKNIIFAIEEPETSQHPDHQEMLIGSLIELSNSGNTQVLLTTHTPSLASLLPLESLRFIENVNNVRTVTTGDGEVFRKIADTLGVLPEPFPKGTKALILVEGKSDVIFLQHLVKTLKENGVIEHTFKDKGFAIIPVGGCGNLKHWCTLELAHQFNAPYCVLLDSDKGTVGEKRNFDSITKLRKQGIKAHLTRKRELENYIHPECVGKINGKYLEYSDEEDAKKIISRSTKVKENDVIDYFWPKMTFKEIREIERYMDNGIERFELTEIVKDFLSILI